jgi:GTPase Era involved in 16S rRNA processing
MMLMIDPTRSRRFPGLLLYFPLMILILCLQCSRTTALMEISSKMKSTIAFALNKAVNIPLISEAQEQEVALQLVELCLDPFEKALPEIEFLKKVMEAADNEETKWTKEKIREKVVTYINANVNLPYIGEGQEAKVIGIIVDCLLIAKLQKIDQLI